MGPMRRGPAVFGGRGEFLGATKHLYNWLCPSVGWLVGRSVGRSHFTFFMNFVSLGLFRSYKSIISHSMSF